MDAHTRHTRHTGARARARAVLLCARAQQHSRRVPLEYSGAKGGKRAGKKENECYCVRIHTVHARTHARAHTRALVRIAKGTRRSVRAERTEKREREDAPCSSRMETRWKERERNDNTCARACALRGILSSDADRRGRAASESLSLSLSLFPRRTCCPFLSFSPLLLRPLFERACHYTLHSWLRDCTRSCIHIRSFARSRFSSRSLALPQRDAGSRPSPSPNHASSSRVPRWRMTGRGVRMVS